ALLVARAGEHGQVATPAQQRDDREMADHHAPSSTSTAPWPVAAGFATTLPWLAVMKRIDAPTINAAPTPAATPATIRSVCQASWLVVQSSSVCAVAFASALLRAWMTNTTPAPIATTPLVASTQPARSDH